jgi:hypothetical protein
MESVVLLSGLEGSGKVVGPTPGHGGRTSEASAPYLSGSRIFKKADS